MRALPLTALFLSALLAGCNNQDEIPGDNVASELEYKQNEQVKSEPLISEEDKAKLEKKKEEIKQRAGEVMDSMNDTVDRMSDDFSDTVDTIKKGAEETADDISESFDSMRKAPETEPEKPTYDDEL